MKIAAQIALKYMYHDGFSPPPPPPKKPPKNKRPNSIGGFSFPSAYSLATGQFGSSGYYYVAGAPGFSNLNGVVGSVRGC